MGGMRRRLAKRLGVSESDTRVFAARTYRRGLLLVLLGSICASWIGLGVRMMDAATAWQILVFRSVGLVAFLMVFIALRHPGRIAGVFRNAGRASILGGAALATAFCGSIVAIEQTSVANAMFLLAAAPFMAAVLGRWFLGERVRVATWVAISCAFLGIAIMVAEGVSFGFVRGNVAGLLAACGFAVFVIALRWGHLTDMLPLNVIAGVIGALIALAVCQITGVGLRVSGHDALLGVLMGVFQLGFALVLITAGSRSVPAAEVSLLMMTEVVLAPLWVWLVLGETAGVFTLLGGALVLGAIYWDAVSGLKQRRMVARP